MDEGTFTERRNPLAAFLTIRVIQTHRITKQTLKWYQLNVSKDYKVGDKEKSILIKLVDKINELPILYATHLKIFLQKNKHSFERDFIEDEIKKVERFITLLETADPARKSEWYGLLKRYNNLLKQKRYRASSK